MYWASLLLQSVFPDWLKAYLHVQFYSPISAVRCNLKMHNLPQVWINFYQMCLFCWCHQNFFGEPLHQLKTLRFLSLKVLFTLAKFLMKMSMMFCRDTATPACLGHLGWFDKNRHYPYCVLSPKAARVSNCGIIGQHKLDISAGKQLS